jgi:hypothetical protein
MLTSRLRKPLPTNKPKLAVYLDKPIDDVLSVLAEKEERSRSQMALILIREALTARGIEMKSE